MGGMVREPEARAALAGGRSAADLAPRLPAANRPGAELVVVETCRQELAGCPHALLDLAPWREALDAWRRAAGLDERLGRRISEGRILYHHKLRIALAGCPNGCSRPQIADLALVGTLTPRLAPAACLGCGACVSACPDAALEPGTPPVWEAAACQGCLACRDACPTGAVSLAPPRARLLAGGKLGRHPRLAAAIGEAGRPGEACELLASLVEGYLAESRPGERFATWWGRTRGETTRPPAG